MNTTKKMVETFKNPPNEYNPAVMWFWNGDISEEGITYQLEKYREQGLYDFFIQPCAQMKQPYLSDRFMELIKYVVKEAKRLGMRYWIYDEFEYPSGVVGGQLLEQYPEYRQKELAYIVEWLNPVGMSVTKHVRGKLISAISIKEKNGQYFVIDITDKCDVKESGFGSVDIHYQNDCTVFEQIVFFIEKYNESYVPSAAWAPESSGGYGYVSTIDEKAIAKWIEMTHEKYKAAIGDEFGKTVMGMFTDEPTTIREWPPNVAGPWSDTFAEEFEKEHGYSIIPYLYAIFYKPLNAHEKKVRDDYRTTVKHLYHKSFINQYSKWCRDNNLKLTGHFAAAEWMGGSIDQGDMQIEAMKMDIPGDDTVFSAQWIDHHDFNVSAKLISSAAKLAHKNRVFCETYTGSGWELDMPIIKRVAHRLAIQGVNMLQFMGGHYTLRENRKIEPGILPSSHGYANKLFRHYGKFSEYMAGISSLSAATVPDGKVLVLNALRETIQHMDYHYTHKVNVQYEKEQKIYECIVNGLYWSGIEFDLFSEDLVGDVKVTEGSVEACGYKYDCVILPSMEHVNRETAELVQKLKKNNVKTLFMCKVPKYIVETEEETNYSYDFKDTDNKSVYKDGNSYLITPGDMEYSSELYAEIFPGIIGGVALNIKYSGSRVYISKRANDDTEVYLIANDEDKMADVSIDALPGMKIYNTTKREEAAYPVENGRVSINLHPYEMVVAIVDKASNEPYAPLCEKVNREMVYTFSPDYAFEAMGGNILPVRSFEAFDKETGTWEKGEYMELPEGMSLTPGEEYKIRGEVNFEYIPTYVYLNAEIYNIKSLKLNGREVKLTKNTVLWSEADCRCDVTALLQEGINTIEVDCVADSARLFISRPPFIFFSGKFEVNDHDVAVKPKDYLELGGWEKQGYPYFIGNGVYRHSQSVTGMEYSSKVQMWKKAVIEVKTSCAAEIYINNKYAGSILWAPYELDITEFLHTYDNEIRIVLTSTNANLFGKHTVNGITEPVKIKLYD